MRWLLLSVFVVSTAAQAQVVCDQPRPRDTSPLLKAIQEDDAMASTFDVTAGACVEETAACDAQKLKCGDQLANLLQSQVKVDNGMWLRDMLLPFLSQRYTMTANIATSEVVQDVSCNLDAPSLKAAATRRRQVAARRRDIVNEYPKWAMWAAELARKCKVDAQLASKAQNDAAAIAKAQADAALASKQAEELRQENARKAEQAAKDKAEAERKAREDAAKALADAQRRQLEAQAEQQRKQQEAQAELIRKQQEAREEQLRKEREARMTEAERAAEAIRRAEEQKKREAEELERKRLAEIERQRREAQAIADAKLVAEREAKKSAAEKKADELRAQEEARRLAAEKQIAAIENVDRSDERLAGSLGAEAQGGYMSLSNTNAGALAGVLIRARYGFWMTAPAQGMASGVELKLNAQFFGQVTSPGGAQYFTVTPELRWFIARFGFGPTFEYRHLVTTHTGPENPADSFALGVNVALAAVDNPNGRVIITARWLPFLGPGASIFTAERITAEVELGYKWFSASIQGGTVTVRSPTASSIGWYLGAGLGGRLRF